MANVKISGLTPAANVASDNQFEINESGSSKRVTAQQIADFALNQVPEVPVATQQEAEAGTVNDKFSTPLRTAQQTTARLATEAEAEAGTDNTRLMTPLRSQQQRFANGPLAGFRNAIINGNFDHWQRGTSFSGNEYGADRWFNSVIGSSATQSQQAFALGQTDVPNEPEYFARTVVSSVAGAGNFSILQQRIEDVRSFAGQTVTLSFYAKADAAKNIAVDFSQNFGTGGSPSVPVTALGVTTISLTTTFQKFTVTAALPSIAGKTLGTNGNHFLSINLWFDAGSNFDARTNSLGQQSGTFDIAQVQLEAGSVATPFERRPVGTELALCQRYYQTGRIYGWVFAGTVGNVRCTVERYKVTMRASPAVIVSGMTFVNANTFQVEGDGGTGFGGFVNALGAGAINASGSYTADAEL